MTERDYIVASELRAIRIVKDIVRDLIAVDEAEQRTMMTVLRRWEAKFEKEGDLE